MAGNAEAGWRPRIGVTWVTPGEKKSDNYIEAVRRAGGEPVVLAEDADSWAGELQGIDGLLLTGGGDVAPGEYGASDSGLCRGVEPKRDELERQAFDFCRERGLPVLGVCRGLQFVNVAMGGSLLQDLATEHPEALPHPSVRDVSRHHPVLVQPGTRLSAILGRNGEAMTNSRHHQGLTAQQLAPGLRISATAPDGIVEALEAEGESFLMAVQCHPERLGEAAAFVPVFAALVEQASRRRSGATRRGGDSDSG